MMILKCLQVLKQNHFDLILLDYLLPDGNGLDFLRSIEKEGSEIPAVVITGQGDEMIAKQVIQAGAYDYLPKDRIGEKSLLRVLINTLEKARLKREIKNAQKKIAMMSIRDELTGLYNRRYFNEIVEKEVSRAMRYETDLVLCMIDLDYFKKINDTYGHLAGDMTLSEIAGMLKKCVRQSDLCCRYGGEEGITAYQPELKQSSTELVEAADNALYQAKAQGRNRVVTIDALSGATDFLRVHQL